MKISMNRNITYVAGGLVLGGLELGLALNRPVSMNDAAPTTYPGMNRTAFMSAPQLPDELEPVWEIHGELMSVAWVNSKEQSAEKLFGAGAGYDGLYGGLLHNLDIQLELLTGALESAAQSSKQSWEPHMEIASCTRKTGEPMMMNQWESHLGLKSRTLGYDLNLMTGDCT